MSKNLQLTYHVSPITYNMDYSATSKYIRVSTRKMRLVADGIRKLTPDKALVTLSIMTKRAGEPLAEVIKSALANAKQHSVSSSSLRFKTIEVMGGPVLKRWHAASRGMAHGYKKRMTHVRIVVTDAMSSNKTQPATGGKEMNT